MTVLEELIEHALTICENSRASGQKNNARGAVLLTSGGRVYTGCDVVIHGIESQNISAERAAILAAVADGSSEFNVSFLHYINYL
jgi:cytidine deaminase